MSRLEVPVSENPTQEELSKRRQEVRNKINEAQEAVLMALEITGWLREHRKRNVNLMLVEPQLTSAMASLATAQIWMRKNRKPRPITEKETPREVVKKAPAI